MAKIVYNCTKVGRKMAPSSYKAPSKNDKLSSSTKSQSIESNLFQSKSTIANVLENKGCDDFSVQPKDTIYDVVRILKEKHIGALVITNDKGMPEGILSERDIVRRMAETPGQTLPQLAEDLMTRDIEVCTPEDLVMDVLKRMSEGRFRHMPVINNRSLWGMTTIGDLVQFRLKELEYEALQMKQMIVG